MGEKPKIIKVDWTTKWPGTEEISEAYVKCLQHSSTKASAQQKKKYTNMQVAMNLIKNSGKKVSKIKNKADKTMFGKLKTCVKKIKSGDENVKRFVSFFGKL